MLVRELRAILNKIPDDANVVVKIKDTKIGVGPLLYSPSQNLAMFKPDDTDVDIAITNLVNSLREQMEEDIREEIDDL